MLDRCSSVIGSIVGFKRIQGEAIEAAPFAHWRQKLGSLPLFIQWLRWRQNSQLGLPEGWPDLAQDEPEPLTFVLWLISAASLLAGFGAMAGAITLMAETLVNIWWLWWLFPFAPLCRRT